MDCLFCKIIDKTVPSQIVYEDNHFLAFNDIYPQAPSHLLIIPKKHVETINDLHGEDDHMVGQMILIAKELATELKIASQGYRLVFNCNADGGQEIYHIHLHLLGGRKLHWPPG